MVFAPEATWTLHAIDDGGSAIRMPNHMNVRMAKARIEGATGEVFAQEIGEPSDRERKSYRCWYCPTVPVSFVHGGKTENGVQIRPHFRRNADFMNHGPSCGFDFKAQMSAWEDQAEEIISKSNNRIVLLLDHLVKDYSISAQAEATGEVERRKFLIANEREVKRRAEHLRRLTCHASRDLWKMACMLDDDSELRKRILLKLGNRMIDWSEFFFRIDIPEEAMRLSEMIEKQPELPACIVGNVHAIQNVVPPQEKPDSKLKDPYVCLKLSWANIPVSRKLEVSISSRIPSIFSGFHCNSRIVISGMWSKPKKMAVTERNRNIFKAWCWINMPEQLALCDEHA